MFHSRIVWLLLALFLILAHRSDAVSPWKIRKRILLADTKPEEKASPAPSPGSVSGGVQGSGKETDPTGGQGCLASSEACHIKDMSACLRFAAPKEALLVLQNSGEIPLKVNVTFLPSNTFDEIQLAKQQITEVNVTEGNSSIVLNAGDGDCVVQMTLPASGGNFYKHFSYASRVTPIHGVYLLFATVLAVGGVWACCKFGKNGRHADGVAYQELEMGRTEADSISAIDVVDVESPDGWDESWEDDWGDEIREVKPSPSRSQVGNGLVNGHKSKSSNKDGWEGNWDE